MKRRIMLIGPDGCGKTSLARLLCEKNVPLKKTQDVTYWEKTIDVPGAYLCIPDMYGHLITISQNHASCMLMLIEQSRNADVYAPQFAKVFTCPVIGVITKCDIPVENEGLCEMQLERAGIEKPFYKISICNGFGLEELRRRLKPFL